MSNPRMTYFEKEDIASFIMQLASKGGTYNLTDGHDVSFTDLSQRLSKGMHKRQNPSLPRGGAYALAKVGDVVGRLTQKQMPFDSITLKKMTSDLTFSCDKAIEDFSWKPTPVLDRIEEICDSH
jgi:hypothetical protein